MHKKILFLFLFFTLDSVVWAEAAPSTVESTEEVQTRLKKEKIDPPNTVAVINTDTENNTESTKTDTKVEIRTGRTTTEEQTPPSDDTGELVKQLTQQAKDKVLSEVIGEKTASVNQNKKSASKKVIDPALDRLNKEQKLLMMENIVKEERLKKQNTALRAQLQRLKWEKDVLNTQLDVDALKEEAKNKEANKKHQDKLITLSREVELSEERTRKLNSDLEAQRVLWEIKTAKLEAEIDSFHIEAERKKYADNKPVYLDNPLINNDTLIVSDRRISMNGLITPDTADYVAIRINYYNNKNSTKPIFLIIDSSPGGSAMAGYRIIKAMEASKAPVYVVVKSLAASMAAIITTVAEHSFAYPNAIIVHHQLAINLFLARLNVTQQKEMYEDSKKWWERMMGPVVKKMGITSDEFIKQMYAKASSGDWAEFGTEAKELRWVNHIVQRIEETSLIKDPDTELEEDGNMMHEELNAKGRAVVYLPHLSAKDAYFVYNPDQYYQVR